ncbi:MAG: hypothetical protein C4308_06760 [Chitinophagaceae bacterium]
MKQILQKNFLWIRKAASYCKANNFLRLHQYHFTGIFINQLLKRFSQKAGLPQTSLYLLLAPYGN